MQFIQYRGKISFVKASNNAVAVTVPSIRFKMSDLTWTKAGNLAERVSPLAGCGMQCSVSPPLWLHCSERLAQRRVNRAEGPNYNPGIALDEPERRTGPWWLGWCLDGLCTKQAFNISSDSPHASVSLFPFAGILAAQGHDRFLHSAATGRQEVHHAGERGRVH